MKKKIAVLTENITQFEYYKKEFEEMGELIYISSTDSARGIYFDEFIVVGTFWERFDAGEIYNQVVPHTNCTC